MRKLRSDLHEFIKNQLWSGAYFDPAKAGEEKVLFSNNYSTPLVANVIDGVASVASWPVITGGSATSTFFIKTKKLVSKYGASWVYINDPDNCLSIIEWENKIDPQYYNQHVLEEFEKNPAPEGGISQLVLVFDDREGIVVFLFGDEEEFKISFFGSKERYIELHQVLIEM